MKQIADHFSEALSVLQVFATEATFQKIEKAGAIMVESLANGGKIISCGNGGSMCDAMHFAEELTGRYRDVAMRLQGQGGITATCLADAFVDGNVACTCATCASGQRGTLTCSNRAATGPPPRRCTTSSPSKCATRACRRTCS